MNASPKATAPLAAPVAAPVTLDVTLRWKQDPIASRHLQGTGTAAVGELPDAMAPIPCDALGCAGFVFASLDAGRAKVIVPAGAMATRLCADGRYELIEGPTEEALAQGESIELRVGAFSLSATAAAPVELPPAAPLAARARGGAWLHIGFAAAAHAVVLGLAGHAAMAAQFEDDEPRADEIRQLMVAAEQRARAVDAPEQQGIGANGGGEVNGRSGDGRAGGGARAAGAEGAMGDRDSRSAEHRRYAAAERVPKEPSPVLSHDAALKDAATFGMVGLLGEGAQPAPSPWFGADEARGADPIAARGEMWATSIGSSFAVGGLGLTGIGEGGGRRGEGIGLDAIGTVGHTYGRPGSGTGGGGNPLLGTIGGWSNWDSAGFSSGRGSFRRGHAVLRPRSWGDAVSVTGRLPPEAVQRIIRQNFGRFRLCYEKALVHTPALSGRVTARFVIGRDGAVSSVSDGGSSMPDPAVVSCVIRSFYSISFPQPEGGVVTVTYPIVFSPTP